MDYVKSVLGHLLIIPKKKIKERINVEKITFYNSKVLNAQNPKRIFLINMLN
jgi:hypothetical protein